MNRDMRNLYEGRTDGFTERNPRSATLPADVVEALRKLADCPIEEFWQGQKGSDDRPDDFVIFGMNDWKLTYGDVRKAKAVLKRAGL